MRRPWSARSKTCPRWSKKSMVVPPSSSSATSSRIPRRGVSQTSTKSSPNSWMLPNDLSARTEENQNHEAVGGERQPHLGWRSGLPDRRTGLVDRAARRRDREQFGGSACIACRERGRRRRGGRRLYRAGRAQGQGGGQTRQFARTHPVEGSHHRPASGLRLIHHVRI